MIDRQHIGRVFEPRSAVIEPGRLRFFSGVIGGDASKSSNGTASNEPGNPAQTIPPTFLFCLEMDTGLPLDVLEILNIDITRILHGEQSFTYHAPVIAGDTVTFKSRIADIYDKKGGALEFFVLASEIHNQHNNLVAESSQVIAVRN